MDYLKLTILDNRYDFVALKGGYKRRVGQVYPEGGQVIGLFDRKSHVLRYFSCRFVNDLPSAIILATPELAVQKLQVMGIPYQVE